ncbi:hypothetical protein TNCT_618991 [Trichonephila clavata]|uniref:Uncharacterized protein n=1 Tax=Trichonephila clavata TaxID=2740835 RepID=A0A8X6F8M1_TRICU|nr:hypothetical protein TNCT_618991 [Trichonephila clavata]
MQPVTNGNITITKSLHFQCAVKRKGQIHLVLRKCLKMEENSPNNHKIALFSLRFLKSYFSQSSLNRNENYEPCLRLSAIYLTLIIIISSSFDFLYVRVGCLPKEEAHLLVQNSLFSEEEVDHVSLRFCD